MQMYTKSKRKQDQPTKRGKETNGNKPRTLSYEYKGVTRRRGRINGNQDGTYATDIHHEGEESKPGPQKKEKANQTKNSNFEALVRRSRSSCHTHKRRQQGKK